jgi:hypothetical protein
MTTNDLDATLGRLTDASEAIGANLLELERDPARRLLDAATLTGETAGRWASATRLLDALWQRFTRFNELLDRARSLRGSRTRLAPDREAELTALLHGPSIELDADDVPLGQRALLGERRSTTRVTPDELLARMSEDFEQVMGVVVAAGGTWDALVPRVNRAREVLAQVAEVDPALAAGVDPARLERRLDRFADVLATDPIAIGTADLDAIELALQGLQAGLDDAAEVRTSLPDRITRARAALDELRSESRLAADAYDEARRKIGAPAVAPAPEFDPNVDEELDAVLALADQGRWLAADRALTSWETRVEDLAGQVRASIRASRHPIDARNELRGRLDAYQAMAEAHGVLEDREVAARYELARAALYNAPADLDRAVMLVRAYQDSLSERGTARKEAR